MAGEENRSGIEEVTGRCMDSQGYMLFACYLTSKADAQNRPIIEHQYRRYHFSLEDAKHSLKELRAFIDAEIQSLQKMSEENEA